MSKKSRTAPSILQTAAWIIVLSLLITACGTTAPSPVTKEATEAPEAVPSEPAATIPTEPPAPVPTEPPAAPTKPPSGLSADPQRVEFQASDGKNLVGYYYPSKYADAPVVILMHWAGGDLTDWCEIAPWLQNRADENPVKPERCANAGAGLPASIATTWLDSSWFPPMNAEISIAVLAFDFRGYGESEAGGRGIELTKDAQAAFATASGLAGVDASRMAAMGASIGADGAPDGCLLYNQEAGGGCLGALSLSPGNFLEMDYTATVTELAPAPVWCLTAEGDEGSSPTCKATSRDNFRAVIYPGTDLHGMRLIAPELDPNPMKLIQDFLELVFAEPVK